MGILNLKKNKAVAVEAPKKTRKLAVKETKSPAVIGSAMPVVDVSGIIVRPRVTEKATMLSEKGRAVVVFEVTRKANKRNVALAVQTLYKVVPVKVAVLRVPPKKSFVRGRISHGVTTRKAYVYLKEGDKIEVA